MSNIKAGFDWILPDSAKRGRDLNIARDAGWLRKKLAKKNLPLSCRIVACCCEFAKVVGLVFFNSFWTNLKKNIKCINQSFYVYWRYTGYISNRRMLLVYGQEDFCFIGTRNSELEFEVLVGTNYNVVGSNNVNIYQSLLWWRIFLYLFSK